LFKKFEKLKVIKKYVNLNLLHLTKNKHFLIKIYLRNLKFFRKFKKISKTQIVRRCISKNRSRGVFRSFNVSRNVLRETIQFGLIPGYKKSIW
jgi:ribosomal protein S14